MAYISPEILASSAAALSPGNQSKNNSVSGSRGKSSDVWSMGVMLYTMYATYFDIFVSKNLTDIIHVLTYFSFSNSLHAGWWEDTPFKSLNPLPCSLR